jgi:hypothetical protein
MFADMLYGTSHDCGHINFTPRIGKFRPESKSIYAESVGKNGRIVQILRQPFRFTVRKPYGQTLVFRRKAIRDASRRAASSNRQSGRRAG